MQPVKLTIGGDFWDSYVYRGRLYLWDMTGGVSIINWDALVDSIATRERNQFLRWALSRGDELYGQVIAGSILKDPDVEALIRRKLADASLLRMEFDLTDLQPFLLGRQDTPFRGLHDDLEVFRNTAYALTEIGLCAAEVHKPTRNKRKVERSGRVLWDGAALRLAVNGPRLALACGGDGLYVHDVSQHLREQGVKQPTCEDDHETTSVHWAFASVYGCSESSGGFLVGYAWDKVESPDAAKPKFERRYVGVRDEIAMFGTARDADLSWAGREKLYRAGPTFVEAVQFTQGFLEDDDGHAFRGLGDIALPEGVAGLLSAESAFFGAVMEVDGGLLLLHSNEKCQHLPGAVTRWRAFPRSIRYPNHLHIVFDDRVDILSINDDIFARQDTKRVGMKFEAPPKKE